MEGYQLPAFDTTAPLKPSVSSNNVTPSGTSSMRGFDSFAFLDAPPKDIVLSPPVSTPKTPNDDLPAYEPSSNLSSVQLSFNATSVPDHRPAYGYPPSAEAQKHAEMKPVSTTPPSGQPPLYQLPYRQPETPLYHPQPQQVVQPLITQPVRTSAQPAYAYPGTTEHKDPVKALIEAYPNPQTEYEKLRQSIENMNSQVYNYSYHFLYSRCVLVTFSCKPILKRWSSLLRVLITDLLVSNLS